MMIKTLKTGFTVLLIFLLTLTFITEVNAENLSQNILRNYSNSWGEKTAELLMADDSEDFSPIEYS